MLGRKRISENYSSTLAATLALSDFVNQPMIMWTSPHFTASYSDLDHDPFLATNTESPH